MQTLTDKVVGLKDVTIGKLKHNPEQVQHGKEQRSGELKRKKLEGDNVSLAASVRRSLP